MGSSTAIVWFRRDLRCHDHPALAAAARDYDRIVSLLVFDAVLLHGRFAGAPRIAYAHVLLTTRATRTRRSVQPRLRALEWDADEGLLQAWQEGRTGYPLVDAGMRQLARTGWMANRARLWPARS